MAARKTTKKKSPTKATRTETRTTTAKPLDLAAIRAAAPPSWLSGPSAEDREVWARIQAREEPLPRHRLDPWHPTVLALKSQELLADVDHRVWDKAHRLGHAALNDVELTLYLRSLAVGSIRSQGLKVFLKEQHGAAWQAQVLALRAVGDRTMAAVLHEAGLRLGRKGPSRRRSTRASQVARASGEDTDPLPDPDDERFAGDGWEELDGAFLLASTGPEKVLATFVRAHVRELELLND